MRILIFSQYYHPEQFLINEIAEGLVERGHKVSVITGLPNYPGGIVFPGYKSQSRRDEIINGVEVHRCSIIPRGSSKLHLILNYVSYMCKANARAKQLTDEYDVVFLYQLTPILQAYPAIKYAKKHKKRLICYCLDLAPASGEEFIKKRKLLFSLYKRFSKWAYSNCDCIAVTSKMFVDYLQQTHGISQQKIVYLPQHASDLLLKQDLTKHNADGIIDFMFAGSIGFGARLDHIIDAADNLRNMGIQFRIHFVGDGGDKAKLEEMVKMKELQEHVFFYDAVPMNQMVEMYRKADALVVSLRKGQLTVPGKVQAYMATGKPILGAMDGSGRDLIEEAKCGICVAAEDTKAITAMMKDYIDNPDAYYNYGLNGREFFIKHFTLNEFMNGFENLLEDTN